MICFAENATPLWGLTMTTEEKWMTTFVKLRGLYLSPPVNPCLVPIAEYHRWKLDVILDHFLSGAGFDDPRVNTELIHRTGDYMLSALIAGGLISCNKIIKGEYDV